MPYAVYDGKIYSYKIDAELENGIEVLILDEIPIEVSNFVGRTILVSLNAYFIGISNNNNNNSLSFVGYIRFDKEQSNYRFENDFIEIYVPKEEVITNHLEINKLNKYCFEQLQLKEIYE